MVEDDIGTYTIKAVDDPRTLNKVLHMRPQGNILSHNELVSLWENKVGKTFDRVYLSEEEVLKKLKGRQIFSTKKIDSTYLVLFILLIRQEKFFCLSLKK